MWRLIAARERLTEKAAMKIAWLLPRRVVMWCFVRADTHATSGQYGNTVVPELGMMEALERWDTPHVA